MLFWLGVCEKWEKNLLSKNIFIVYFILPSKNIDTLWHDTGFNIGYVMEM
jgi:hypothetical protein